MSNASQLNLAITVTANASQHNATLNEAAQVGKRFGTDVQASAGTAASGIQKVVEQAERVAPAFTQATTATTTGLNTTGSAGQALRQTLGGVGDAAQKAGAASAQGFNQATISAKQYQAALRGVPAQFTDIFTSLASGQAPLTVFMQQGGQLKDMFHGAGNAVRAMGGYVLGMVNPLTVVAGSAAVAAIAFEAGASESRSLQNAIINSGNAAGVTQGQLMGMAAGVDAVVGTQGRAVEVLGAFVATGRVGAAHMEAFTTAAMRFEAVGGAAAEDTAKSFAELGKAPVEASLKLNDSMGYLTASTYAQIKALADQGRQTEAADLAQKAFADTLNSRSSQMEANLGLVEKGWKGIKWAVTEAWDAIKSIGRDGGAQGLLNAALANLDSLQSKVDSRKARGLATGDLEQQLSAAKALVESKKEEVRLLQKGADVQADQVRLAKQLVAWDKDGAQYASTQQKREEEIRKAKEQGQALIIAGKLTEKELAERIAAIEARHKDKSPVGDTELANITARVSVEQRNLELLRTQGVQADKLNDGERMALQLAEQLNGKLDARVRTSKEAQLVQARTLGNVLNQQQAERELQQAKAAAAALDEKLTGQQIGKYQQAIDQLVTSNEQLRTEIDLVGKDTAARRLYVAAKVQEVITAKELEVINLRNAGARQEVIDKAEQELRLLRDKLTLTGQVNSAQDGQAAIDMLDAIQRETIALGQSNEQRQLTVALRELDNKGIKAGSAAYEEYIPKIKAAISGKAVAEQSVAFWGSVEGVARDAWNHIGNDGENAAQRIERALKAGVWDMLWQITGRRWLIDIGASLGIPGAALAQAQAGSSLLGTVSNAGSLYNTGSTVMGWLGLGGATAGTGIAATAGTGLSLASTAGTGLGLSASAGSGLGLAASTGGGVGLTASTAGAGAASAGAAGGAMSSFAAAAPWVLGALAVASILSSMDDSGTLHTGGMASYSATGGLQTSTEHGAFGMGFGGVERGEQTVGMASGLTRSTVGMLDSTSKLFGGKGGYSVATGFADDSSRDSAWGGLLIKDGDGKTQVNWNDSRTSRWAPREFADGQAGAAEYAKAVALDVRSVLMEQTPVWADTMLSALGDAPTLEQLSTTVAQIHAAAEAFDTMGRASEQFASLGESALDALVVAMGGAEAAVAGLGNYYSSFYTDAERADVTRGQLQDKFTGLGLGELPQTRDQFRALVESLDLTTESGRAMYAELIKLSPAFAGITQSTQEAAADMTRAANEMARAAEQAAAQAAQAADDALATANAALQQSVDRSKAYFAQFVGSIDEASSTLGSASSSIKQYLDGLNAKAQGVVGLRAAQSAFSAQLTFARGGDRDALNGITGYADTLIQAINANAGSAAEARVQQARVQAQLAALPGQVSAEQLIVDAIDRQTLANANALTTNFRQLDANVDGLLTFEELRSAGFATDGQIGNVIAALDANGDGQISALEALGATLGAKFDAIDVDLSGAIDYAEFAKNFAGLGSDATLRSIFAELDTNGDGQISRLEAIKNTSGETAANTYGLDKLTRISEVVNSLQWGTDAWNAASVKALATVSGQQGWTAADISTALGRFTSQEIVDFFAKYGASITQGGIGTGNTTTAGGTSSQTPGASGFVIGGSGGGAATSSTGGNNGITFVEPPKYVGVGGTAIYDPATVGRLDSISAYVNTLDWGAANKSASAAALAATAAQYGVTAREIAIATGYSEADILALNPSIPRFELGGMHMGGARIVGEGGPELEITGPARYFNAAQTMSMLRSGGAEGAELLAEIRALRSDLQAQASANLRMQQRSLRLYERWDGNGLPETRVTT